MKVSYKNGDENGVIRVTNFPTVTHVVSSFIRYVKICNVSKKLKTSKTNQKRKLKWRGGMVEWMVEVMVCSMVNGGMASYSDVDRVERWNAAWWILIFGEHMHYPVSAQSSTSQIEEEDNSLCSGLMGTYRFGENQQQR